jgi:hypothetical protein
VRENPAYATISIAAILTLGGVYSAGATRGRAAGLWATAFWTILCGAPTLQANQPNTEVFINACVVWALALMLRAGDSPGGVLRALAVGALLAFGSIIKQLVVIDAALLSLAYVAFCDGLPGGRRRAIRDVAIMAAVGAVCWFSVLAYFAAVGRFDFFWVTTFINSRAYAGNPLFNLFRYVREGKFFPRFLWFSAPVMALVLRQSGRWCTSSSCCNKALTISSRPMNGLGSSSDPRSSTYVTWAEQSERCYDPGRRSTSTH